MIFLTYLLAFLLSNLTIFIIGLVGVWFLAKLKKYDVVVNKIIGAPLMGLATSFPIFFIFKLVFSFMNQDFYSTTVLFVFVVYSLNCLYRFITREDKDFELYYTFGVLVGILTSFYLS